MGELLNISGIFQNGPKTMGDTSTKFPNYFLTEEEKLEDDKINLKRLFNYHQSLATAQINLKKRKYEKNYMMSSGIIDPGDFGLSDEDNKYSTELDVLTPGEKLNETIKLEYFSISPNIVNSLKQELLRKYNNYYPRAIDSDSISEILDTKNKEIVDILVQQYKQKYEQSLDPKAMQDPQAAKQAEDAFQKLPLVEKYYRTEYKPEIVLWAEHQMRRDELKFDLETLGKDVFEDQLVLADRYLHVSDMGDDYTPELLDPRLCAHIKSPMSKCVSMGSMFHWFEHLTLQGLITKYGHEMNADDIEQCTDLFSVNSVFTLDTSNYQNNKYNNQANTDNWFALQSLIDDKPLASGLLEISNQYFLLPRKLGKLTVRLKLEGSEFEDTKDIVTEDYTVMQKPKYDGKASLENLIEGEHIDWFYINEVYFGRKINLRNSKNASIINPDTKDNTNKDTSIWIKIEKLSYQGKPEDQLFGTVIPVFGGPTNFKNEEYNKSVIDVTAPYQVYYNYLMNKIKELVITELMPFYVMNKELLGPNSLEDSWQDDPIFKFVLLGQETGISIADTSSMNTMALNAFQQNGVISLDRSVAIKTRWELAQIFKNECYAQVGISPQFLGDVKPDETATGVLQGINRSATQIQHLYDDHSYLMRKVRQYMLELAQIKHFTKGGLVDLTYVDSDAQTQIFRMEAANLPLTRRIGIFVVDGVKANETLEKMKQLALMDNTMGSDALEKLIIMKSNSEAGLFSQLKEERANREKREDAQQQNMGQQQQAQLEAQTQAQLAKQQFDAEQHQLDRETEVLVAQIKAIGMSKNIDQNSNSEFDVTELAKMGLQNKKISNDLSIGQQQVSMQQSKQAQDLEIKRQELLQKKQDSSNTYSTKLKEIEAKLKISANNVQIAKVNKN